MKITKSRIAYYDRFRDDLKDHMRSIFDQYCEIFGIFKAYGLERWSIHGDSLYITQDISCRGCYDNEQHILPAEWIYMNKEELTVAMKAAFDKKKKEEDRQEALEQERLASAERKKFEELKAKYGQ